MSSMNPGPNTGGDNGEGRSPKKKKVDNGGWLAAATPSTTSGFNNHPSGSLGPHQFYQAHQAHQASTPLFSQTPANHAFSFNTGPPILASSQLHGPLAGSPWGMQLSHDTSKASPYIPSQLAQNITNQINLANNPQSGTGLFGGTHLPAQPLDDKLRRTYGHQSTSMTDKSSSDLLSSTQGLAPVLLPLAVRNFKLRAEAAAAKEAAAANPHISNASSSSSDSTTRRSSQRIAALMERKKHALIDSQSQAKPSGRFGGQPIPAAKPQGSRPQARPSTLAIARLFGTRLRVPFNHEAIPRTLQDYGKKLRQKRCPGCQSLLITDGDLSSLRDIRPEPYQPHPFHACKNCRLSVCMGCNKTLGVASSLTLPTPSWPAHVAGCDGGWLFVFWLLLCRDQKKQQFDKAARESRIPRSHIAASNSGVGYAGGAYELSESFQMSGLNTSDPAALAEFYAACGFRLPVDSVMRGMKQKRAEQAVKDEAISLALNGINELLRSSGPCPPIVFEMLLRSSLLLEVAELLRNSSIEDMASRHGVYGAVFRFIRRLQGHPDLVCLVYAPRPGLVHQQDIFAATFSPMMELSPDEHESLQPLWASVQELVKPAEQMLAFLKNQKLPQGDASDFLGVCEAIKYTAARAPSRETSTNDGVAEPDVTMSNAEASEPQKQNELAAWHKKHSVEFVEDDLLLAQHAFRQRVLDMKESSCGPGRMKRLASEVTALATSLPEGIYVRYGSSRLDVMKIIITGPRETPYENGLFEFDLVCPEDYPKSPPRVSFRTTGGGIRLNPNLYPDGKVCLSLLGTWTGETWRADASTILQVLVSIQSMIFCQEPWYNEPGRENRKDPAKSQRYNILVHSWTIKAAIEPWVQQRNHKVWADVVDRHFRASSDAILARAAQWAAEAEANQPRSREEAVRGFERASPWTFEELRKKVEAFVNGDDLEPKRWPIGWR